MNGKDIVDFITRNHLEDVKCYIHLGCLEYRVSLGNGAYIIYFLDVNKNELTIELSKDWFNDFVDVFEHIKSLTEEEALTCRGLA